MKNKVGLLTEIQIILLGKEKWLERRRIYTVYEGVKWVSLVGGENL